MDDEAWRQWFGVTLTQRELEVVRCLMRGLTTYETANHLGLSQDTIKSQLCRIFDKLGVSTRRELLLFAGGSGNGPEGADAAGIVVRKPKSPHSGSGAAAASLDE